MRRAIQLAENGRFKVAPNPMVGAVIVHSDRIIGEGFHREFGSAHAEVNAVNSVQNQSVLSEATMYVSLEPCSHFGKTPPCSDLIVEKKFKRVVICNLDPSDKVAGKGIAKLKQNGIEVVSGVLESEGFELNKRFITFHAKRRPYITLKWAETTDGYIGRAQDDPERNDSWITSTLSKQMVHQWRAEEMGILVGKNTALIDNPELNVREVDGRDPIKFMIDSELSLPSDLKVFQAGKSVILNKKKAEQTSLVDYVLYKDDPFESLFQYCRENEIHSILVEGGKILLDSMIEQNLWDEARIFKGQKEFKRGVTAPQIEGAIIKKEKIRGDQLTYLKNSAI